MHSDRVPTAVYRSRLLGEDSYRTPYIEEPDHLANAWRSDQDSGGSGSTTQTLTEPSQLRSRSNKIPNDEILNSKTSSSTVQKISWRQRIKHVTWAYFTLTMATGGIANVLHTVPFKSDWLYVISLMFFFLNLGFYIIIWAMMIARFASYPETFFASIIHPTESLFVPAFAVSFGTILITIVEYGASRVGSWLTETVMILFWFNLALAFILSITIYLVLWSSLTFTIAQMTPIWIFPAYPLLIVGPHAANLSGKLPNPRHAFEVIVGGFTVQGIGFLVSMTIYSSFVYRLMTQKLPADPLRPGMFVSVGPAAFTCSGVIGMASNLQHAIAQQADEFHMGVPAELAAQILKLVADWVSLWLWGLAFWFFFVSAVANLAPLYTHQAHKIPFAMTWFSYVFPQTALTTATFQVADAFNIHALKIIGCVMTGLLILAWGFVVVMMIRAIYLQQILWPEKGEDKEEGGFIRKEITKKSMSSKGNLLDDIQNHQSEKILEEPPA